jgi:hypothetical protein
MLIEGLTKRTKRAIQSVVQNLRDIVMLCCRAQADIKDRTGFLAMAAQAYQTTCISKTTRSQLMLSYAKAAFEIGFPSNNAYANNRNGTRDRRDNRPKNSDDTHPASASQEQGDPSSSCCAAATTSSSCTVESAAATSGSACAAAGSMSVHLGPSAGLHFPTTQPQIYQDQQNGKGGGKGKSWQDNDQPWEECCATFPNDAAPGQPSLAQLASDNPCRYQHLMFLLQQSAQYYQACTYMMQQSIWHANEYRTLAALQSHSYSSAAVQQVYAAQTYSSAAVQQLYDAQTYSSAAADLPSSAAAAASSPPAETASSSSAAAASSSSAAVTPGEQLTDFWLDSTMEYETNPVDDAADDNTQHAADDEL